MNYISAEEFLNKSVEIQKTFIDWWSPKIGDLATDRYSDIGVLQSQRDIEAVKIYKGKPYAIPLLQMHQLIQFIEDKGYKIEIISHEDGVYSTNCFLNGFCKICEDNENILKALWEVACKLAEEHNG